MRCLRCGSVGPATENECYEENLDRGIVGLGWADTDLTTFQNDEQLKKHLRTQYPDEKPGTTSQWAGQLRQLRDEVLVGHLVVMPKKGINSFALGLVSKPPETPKSSESGQSRPELGSEAYWYDGSLYPVRCHLVSVDWGPIGLAFARDLRKPLVHRPAALNHIVDSAVKKRLWEIFSTGDDPGVGAGPEDTRAEPG